MSREVRRVPVDFDWPIDKVWDGYLLPNRFHEDRCPNCTRGMTAAADWLYVLCTRIEMLAEDIGDQQRGRPMHPYLAADQAPATTGFIYHPGSEHPEYPKILRPSADILEVVAGLSGETPEHLTSPLRGSGTGTFRKVIEAAGLDPQAWGICPTCEGHASLERYEGQRAESEAWEPAGPPTGDGWQLWETVSDGSPISPVFTTPDDLAAWMADPQRGQDWVPEEVAARFIAEGWAPTCATRPGSTLMTGVEWVGTAGEEEGT